MKRLLGLLLGMVGCGGTVDELKLVERDGLAYEGDSETPFTGVSVEKYENGQKAMEWPYKDRELYGGPWTRWYENG